MNTIREIIRLHLLGLSQRSISRAVRKGKTTVSRFTGKAGVLELTESRLQGMTDDELRKLLDFNPARRNTKTPGAEIDFKQVHLELACDKSVTLQLLWEEYIRDNPDHHYGYSTFCRWYTEWRKPLNATLRKNYPAGEFLFVDFSGMTIPWYDCVTKAQRKAELFVAVLGCSNYTFAMASATQQSRDWINLHRKAFEFFGACPRVVVPDNLKSGVTHADRYDPDLNRTYHEMAEHYGMAILPARSGEPRDKAKVEGAVLIAQRWILARLRKRQFFSLDEINEAIAGLLEQLNNRKLRKFDVSRKTLFETTEKARLQPLPERHYEYAGFAVARVNVDYHVRYNDNYYSAPWRLIGKQITLRVSDTCLEIMFNNQRVASHKRSYGKWQTITDPVHRPENHSQYLKWNPARLRDWASNLGPNVFELVDKMFKDFRHEDYGIRKVLGVLSLAKKFGVDRLETCAGLALQAGYHRVRQLKKLLEEMGDGDGSSGKSGTGSIPAFHENVRGSAYYGKDSARDVN